MKRTLLSLMGALLFLSASHGQVGATWNTLKEESSEAIYFRIIENRGVGILNLKVVHPDLTNINEHQILYLKVGNDFVKLPVQQPVKACRGCGTYKVVSYRNDKGIDVRYSFSKTTAQTMQKGSIDKMRIMMAEGYLDLEIEPKYQSAIKNALKEFYGG
ncbi:MAG: hypothetical protein AAGA85_21755 [Bacteroidota bacterium]